jgi:hypothetical protein
LWAGQKSFQHHSTIYSDFINRPASAVFHQHFAQLLIADNTNFSNFLEASFELNLNILSAFFPLSDLLPSPQLSAFFWVKWGGYLTTKAIDLTSFLCVCCFSLRTPIASYFFVFFAPA